MEAELARLDKDFLAMCSVDVRTIGHDGVRMPDGHRVRTYFPSFAHKYAEVGTRYGKPAPVRTALALLGVLLDERADDRAAAELRAQLLAQLGDEQDAIAATAELARLSVGSAAWEPRRAYTPQSPNGAPPPWVIGTPARDAATPATAFSSSARARATSSFAQPQPPPWAAAAITPRQPALPGSAPRLAGIAPVESLADTFSASLGVSTPASRQPALSPRSAGYDEPPTPGSAARGVLGRKGAPASATRRASSGLSGGFGGASPARTPAQRPAASRGGAELPASPSPRAKQPRNAVASRVQLQQEIRQWRRQMRTAQEAGRQFADRSGPEESWLASYLSEGAQQAATV